MPDQLGPIHPLGTSWQVTSIPLEEDQDLTPNGVLVPHERPAWTAAQASASTAYTGPMPAALEYRGPRELNRQSADEAALAAALHQRQLHVPTYPTANLDGVELRTPLSWSAWFQPGPLEADLTSISSAYRAEAFRVPPPEEPVTTAALVLAVTVVLPELVVVAALATRTRPWTRRDFAAALILSAVGLLAVAGLAVQAATEAAGSAWRATATRTEVVAAIPPGPLGNGRTGIPGGLNLSGTVVQEWETLAVVARTGYRPRLVTATAGVVGTLFVSVAVGVMGRGVWLARRGGGRRAAAPPAADQEAALGEGRGVYKAA